ncbi:MAG: hypothetical protein K2M95_06940, partial [Clostridiales bacterium]|nr:hypothetical protein [Clostridiales bacterium]
MTEFLLAASGRAVFKKLWEALISVQALIVYAAIALILIIFLVVRIVLIEQRRVDEIKMRAKLQGEAEGERTAKALRESFDANMNKIGTQIAAAAVTASGGTSGSAVAAVRSIARQASAAMGSVREAGKEAE